VEIIAAEIIAGIIEARVRLSRHAWGGDRLARKRAGSQVAVTTVLRVEVPVRVRRARVTRAHSPSEPRRPALTIDRSEAARKSVGSASPHRSMMIVALAHGLPVVAVAVAGVVQASSKISRTTTTMSSRALAATLVVASCGGPATIDPGTEARSVWETRCVNCHGLHGRGDGPAGRATFPPPRDFGDPRWQSSDDRIRLAILDGGVAAGLSPVMAPNPDLRDKPAVVEALVAIVRSFRAVQAEPPGSN